MQIKRVIVGKENKKGCVQKVFKKKWLQEIQHFKRKKQRSPAAKNKNQ